MLAGDLTVNGITRSVELALEVLAVEVNGYGQTIAGFEATGRSTARTSASTSTCRWTAVG